jgi:hypothetical protein
MIDACFSPSASRTRQTGDWIKLAQFLLFEKVLQNIFAPDPD